MEYRLAIIGFGNVGEGFAEILHERGTWLEERFGVRFRIVGVCDAMKGSVVDPDGMDPAVLLKASRSGKGFGPLAGDGGEWDGMRLASECEADVVVELTYTDLETGEPAASHLRSALESGKHVVTTNKGPIALHYAELAGLAGRRGLAIGVEGTVMSGTPALRTGLELLRSAQIRGVRGILNGTCNYILSRMESGTGYQEALAEAQAKGYAEADPTGDVEGFDAAAKVVILGNLLMDASLRLADVARTGITGLTRADIADAAAAGQRWKLIGSVERAAGGVRAVVRPERVPLEHPLASVGGAVNAITYDTGILGEVTLVGPGAGRRETGYAVLTDLLEIHRTRS